MKFKKVQKKHIDIAMKDFEMKGYPEGFKQSTYFDVLINGVLYPPKPIMAYANFHATGEEPINNFSGGTDTPCFKTFERLGFKIIEKKTSSIEVKKTRVWIEKTIVKNKINEPGAEYGLGNALISPERAKRGADLYSTMREVRKNDIVIHLIDNNEISGISIAESEYTIVEGIKDAFSSDKKYIIPLTNYTKLKVPLSRGSFLNEANRAALDNIRNKHKVFYNSKLELNQGAYLTEVPIELSELLNKSYKEVTGGNLPLLGELLSTSNGNQYWLFQGNPKLYDFESALQNNEIESWSVSSHKDKIKPGDKIILWLTGQNSGCYGLAEVKSEPYRDRKSSDNGFWKEENNIDFKVNIEITHNLINKPILKARIDSVKELEGLKAGNQGTNFSASKEQYDCLLKMADSSDTLYWHYAPGENGSMWDEFYNKGIIGLGWDKLGDLKHYKSRGEIEKALRDIYGGEGSKKNDISANDDFCNKIKIGDIIIVKKGIKELLGYGEVTSDYYFDKNRQEYKSCRKVNWTLKGNWSVDFNMVRKTLTDITDYPSDHPDYSKYYERLLGIMNGEKTINTKKMDYPLNTILYGPPGTGKTYNTILKAAQIIEGREISSYAEALDIFKSNLHDRIEFITFHQNYSYEDFIQGLRPETDNSSSLVFEKKDGVFKKIADRARENIRLSEKGPSELSNDTRFNIALERFQDIIIDNEKDHFINDTAYIFQVEEDAFRYTGERWTNHINGLRMKFSDLKEFYRSGVSNRKDIKKLSTVSGLANQHATYFFLVYKEILSLLPEEFENSETIKRLNYVIIIDEINRANISRVFGELITLIEPDKRSNGAIPLEARLPSGDTFIVPSNLYIIGTMNTADKSIALLDIALRRRFEFESLYPQYEIDGQKIYDVDILKKINEQIIASKGHDFQIGHAYFMGDNDNLVQRMNKKVIPLLLEYYMNDAEEVKNILSKADLEIEDKSWPLKIKGKK